MLNKPKKIVLLGVIGLTVVTALTWAFVTSRPGQPTFTNSIAIELKDGKPTSAAAFKVKTGAKLDIKVTSDKLGKVGVPTDPPQTITFTQSPLVFGLTASKSGSFPITFLADGASEGDIATIGTIEVQ